MKNINICLTLLLFVFLGISCFEDDSNYDYGTAVYDDYSITMDAIPTSFLWGEPVVVRPLEVTSGPYAGQELDSTKFRWEYYSANFGEDITTPICTTFTFKRDLWKEGAVINTSYTFLLRAIDDYGNIYDRNFSVKYGYVLPTSARWAILCEGNNRESIIHNITGTDTSTFRVFNDCAKIMGHPSIGSGPKSIFFADNGFNVFGVVQESNDMMLIHPYTYATYRTLDQLFQGGTVPAGVKPQYDMIVNGCLGVMWNTDGKLYSKIFTAKAQYSKEKFSERTLKHEDGSEVNCQFLLTNDENPSQRKDLIVYDGTKKGMYLVCGKDLKNAGKVVPILAPASNANLAVPLPEPNDLSEFEVLYAESQSHAINTWYAFLKKDGKMYYYEYTFATDSYYSPKVARATAIKFYEITDFMAQDFPTNTKLYDLGRTGQYLFFVPNSDKKSIYYYDTKTNKGGVFMKFENDGDEEITRIKCMYASTATKSYYMGVARGNKFYTIYITAGAMMPDVAFSDKINGRFEFDEKVVDFIYR